ncbi:hypothetical protein NDU88_003289 [Pleurodeles waltl]|uniref:Uncharacterized protein n=1 Tax=Pleurodeles waltl TaxID=8319 RepID=A0AAV7KXR6_PLEWA|nr:hypothetical protein NDU88_003289 [Pleurodeles waltl]
MLARSGRLEPERGEAADFARGAGAMRRPGKLSLKKKRRRPGPSCCGAAHLKSGPGQSGLTGAVSLETTSINDKTVNETIDSGIIVVCADTYHLYVRGIIVIKTVMDDFFVDEAMYVH